MVVGVPELPEQALVDPKVDWLDRVPQVVALVAEVMWTLIEPVLAARLSVPQCRLWVVVAVPVFAQHEAVLEPGVLLEFRNMLVGGRGLSSMVTPWATPSPELETTIV